MKRIGNLIEQIADNDNLFLAWIKAKKGKIQKAEVLSFEKRLDKNLYDLKQGILKGNVQVGNYSYFIISDPKVRTICAASFRERVLHHSLMNICDPIFERHLIYDTYATRRGKGTYAAIERVKKFSGRYEYYVKLDVKKYFDNIDHIVLKTLLDGLFKDELLLQIMFQIIDSYHMNEGKGVPIGNLTSQYFANHYLSTADHFAKENLRLKGYVRYMDDIIFFGNNKIELKEKYQRFFMFLKEKLKLELKSLVLDKTIHGIPFLGYKVFKYYTRLNQRSKTRFRTKLKKYEDYLVNDKWTEWEYHQHILPLLAFVEYADTIQLRKKIIWNLG